MFEEFDKIKASKEVDVKVKVFIEASKKQLKGVIGFIDPFQLINKIPDEILVDFLKKLNIPIDSSRENSIIKFLDEVMSSFNNSSELLMNYKNPINYLGHFLYNSPELKPYFNQLDYLSMQEMTEIFADWAADLKINVYNIAENEEFPWELFLAKKIRTTKTEIVVFLRGYEIESRYEDAFNRLKDARKYSDWIIFTTTPVGILKIGLEKIVRDMEEIGAWVYVMDPFHSVVYGVLKGKKKGLKNEILEQKLIDTVKYPFRSHDPKKKFSNYTFDENAQYKTKNLAVFGSNPYPAYRVKLDSIEKDKGNLQYVLFLDKGVGKNIDSYKWVESPLDADLISGFITAIETFGSSLSESTGIKEIQYSGFSISCIDGEHIKACMFTKESPSPRLHELLFIAMSNWERIFEKHLKDFQGDLSPFQKRNKETYALLDSIFFGFE